MLRPTLAALVVLACAPSSREPAVTAPAPAPPPPPATPVPPAEPVPPADEPVERMAPPEVAHAHGWMPLASTGADRFVREHPTRDGRGVLIAILDTGVDPGVPGLLTTSTGEPKLVDVRDFSGEGRVPLARVAPGGDSVTVAGRTLAGFGRVVALNTTGPYYAGTLAEPRLGALPASDVNGDGDAADSLPVVVVRAPEGWVLLADTDGDWSLIGERPVRDYLTARETFAWSSRGRVPRVNLAANLAEQDGEPVLDLVLALDAHGTHVRRGRGGERPVRREWIRRRRAGGAVAGAQDLRPRERERLRPRLHPGRHALRHRVRRRAPAAAGDQPELRRRQRAGGRGPH
jgi:hypothetical protein